MPDLPPTQYLVVEVLAARHRLGEHVWTFPTSVTAQMNALERAGLVGFKSGVMPGSLLAWLTEAGRKYALRDGYVPPIEAKAVSL